MCRGTRKVYPEHLRGGMVALDTVPGYDPRVKCPTCDGSGLDEKAPIITKDGWGFWRWES